MLVWAPSYLTDGGCRWGQRMNLDTAHAARLQTCLNSTNSASLVWRLRRRISAVMFTCGMGVARALADSSDLGLRGEQSSQKFVIPCLGRRWTAEQNLTPLALSLAAKSVTVLTHTQTNKQYKNDISTPCVSAYVWIIFTQSTVTAKLTSAN